MAKMCVSSGFFSTDDILAVMDLESRFLFPDAVVLLVIYPEDSKE